MFSPLSKAGVHRPVTSSLARRQLSSKSHNDIKMNALVNLYHQSDRFITPETLSDAIDEAFTKHETLFDDKGRHSFAELVQRRARQRHSPKFFLGRDQFHPTAYQSSGMGPGWIDSKEKRVDRVYEALVGTTRDGKPSWTAVKENAKRVEAQLAADRGRQD
ncbi:hypothetical protein SCLCIDRAFT_1210059 [Scleroderma citrinum Foug A]|uniref:Uncharacterized protein n=1 Tax=Scleroderma citrinum Foug A TaxID=1036808 RepID=A0A0C3A2M8_9AGAM|nr:hypothetical protein SCLCIDRAFT_1210059 [Scleroderma citrinum Foug A]